MLVRSFSRDSLDSIPHLFRFVNTFFKLFLSFFQDIFWSTKISVIFSGAFKSILLKSPFVKTFFHIFDTFLKIFRSLPKKNGKSPLLKSSQELFME